MRLLALMGVAAAVLACGPAVAQSMPGMTMHGDMAGMKMDHAPAAKKAAPKRKPAAAARRGTPAPRVRRTAQPAHDHGAMPGMDMPAPSQGHSGHTMPGMDMPTQHPQDHSDQAMPGMDMSHPAQPPQDHSGHAMPGTDMSGGTATPAAGSAPSQQHDMSAMPGMAMPGHDMAGVATPPAPAGTDLPAGDAPAPAPPMDYYGDRTFGAAAMAHGRHRMMREQGGATFHQILFNIAEYQSRGEGGYRWDGEAWIGGDIDRLWLKTEGEGTGRDGVDKAQLQALYSRAIGPYYNLQGGIRHDVAPSRARTYATIGFEGLAPYQFETEGALFLSEKGDLLARLEGWYDQRITQRLVLQPRAEINLSAQTVRETRLGAGLTDAEVGLRLRYEIRREFAPYVGVSWEREYGGTARLSRQRGEGTGGVSFVAGIRAWF